MLNKKEGVNKMKEVKITAKMKLAIQVLKEVNEGEGAFAREVLNKMVEAGMKRTFNSVNATLAAMATKGYVTKAKGVYGDKMLTQYTLTEAGIAELDKEPEPEPEKEGDAE